MKTVAGLDVHKGSVYLCILQENGEKIERVYGVLTPQLDSMRDFMAENEVSEVAMESTSVYWIPIWRVLVDSFELKLVNPYFIKQFPGRKSDVKDAQWIGPDVNAFPSVKHLVSWCGFNPRNDESNKKIKSNKITHGNRFIRIASVQCAWAASRTKECYFSKFYAFHTQVRKKFKLKVVVAVARKVLVCIWHILKFNVSYKDFEPQKSVAKDCTQFA